MDEARRFLRFTVPGLVYTVSTTLFTWILFPVWTLGQLVLFRSSTGLAAAVAIVGASAAIGYLLGVVHHLVHNRISLWAPIDHKIIAAGRTYSIFFLSLGIGVTAVAATETSRWISLSRARQAAGHWVVYDFIGEDFEDWWASHPLVVRIRLLSSRGASTGVASADRQPARRRVTLTSRPWEWGRFQLGWRVLMRKPKFDAIKMTNRTLDKAIGMYGHAVAPRRSPQAESVFATFMVGPKNAVGCAAFAR